MAIIAELKENWKEEKVNLHNSISSLKKCMNTYKTERKTEWKSFKGKYNEDINEIKKSLKKLITLHKK